VRGNKWLEAGYIGMTEAWKEYPKLRKAIEPRVVIPPHGYPHPKWFAVNLYAQLVAGMKLPTLSQAGAGSVMLTLKLIELSVPTYFVAEQFAQAVAATRPPDDLPLGGLKWPMDAMLFVLPQGFAKAHFGWDIKYLVVGKTDRGFYPKQIKSRLPVVEFDWERELVQIENADDRFTDWFTVECDRDKMPIDFTSSYSMDKVFVDTTKFGKYSDSTSKVVEEEPELYGKAPTEAEEIALAQKMNAFVVSLLMAMVARPELVETGGMIRKRSEKKGRVKPELWHPNVVGRSYRIIRKPGTEAQGTHASPRMHWRMGHMRHQRFGLGLSQTKVIWIEPVIVNPGAKGEA
jgi:hypothetical protein